MSKDILKENKVKPLLVFATLLALVITFRLFTILTGYSVTFIKSSSMEPTLMTGSIYITTDKVDVIRGDIVIFDVNKKTIAKRVVGLPGEEVEIRESGVYINSVRLNESYISKENKKIKYGFGKYTVPENCYFVLGDNRNNSVDSRTSESFTYVKKDWIKGKIIH